MENYFHLHLPEDEIRAISSVGLAHLGDAVYELLVRSWLCAHGKATGKGLHRAAVELVQRLKADPLPADTILNVNVPDIPWSEVKGFEVTRLGNRHRAGPCVPLEDPRGRSWYWIGPAGAEQDAGPGTDFHAVRTGNISITPILVDLTRYQALEQVSSWVDGLASQLLENSQ